MARTTGRKSAGPDAAFDAARKRMELWPQERRTPPNLITPQIPTLAREVPTGLEWIHEIKHDGWRAIVRIEGQQVAVLTRSARNVTRMFSRLVPALRTIGRECILDGEVAAPDDRGVTDLCWNARRDWRG
jgi:bifunctional non-homologous end joining protein LigD